MMLLPSSVRIYLAREPADMRKSIDGLSAFVQQSLKVDIYSGHLFVFLRKRRDRAKILYWENGGFALFYKRLERGCFQRPRHSLTLIREKLQPNCASKRGLARLRRHGNAQSLQRGSRGIKPARRRTSDGYQPQDHGRWFDGLAQVTSELLSENPRSGAPDVVVKRARLASKCSAETLGILHLAYLVLLARSFCLTLRF